jgi:uncharacterized protein with ParB-like and HNH nuclease domain
MLTETPTASVDLIPIKSQTRTVQSCFRECLYEVPNFQRPYSWTDEELEDFWNDVVLARGDFFFGSTVTWVSEQRELFNDTYSIIDGQQRLTTSAIVLSVLRDAFFDLAEKAKSESKEAANSQGAATQRYLIAVDDDGKRYPVLVRPEPMFYEHVQNPDAIPSGAKWNGSAEQLGAARKFFEARVLKELEELVASEAKVDRLKAIRANVLKARVIQVELASEEDGFLIFETLNTRGADLRLADLVKNLLIRGGAKDVQDRQAISDRWDRIANGVQEERGSYDAVDRFIWQSWNSRRPAVKEPELFKAISKHVGRVAKSHLQFLEELEIDARVYLKLRDEGIQAEKKSAKRTALSVPDFVDSVRALSIFDVSVADSAILAIVRKYEDPGKIATDSHLIEVARLIENFHFQFTALNSSGSTGGTRARYQRFAVRLEKADSKAKVAAAIADLRLRLKASLPVRERSEKAFKELLYAPNRSIPRARVARSRKMFITYVLMAFAKSQKLMPPGQVLASWSIEHIKPQAMAGKNLGDPVFSIGNLTLLTSALNSELGDAALPEKMEAMRKRNAFFDPELERWAKSGESMPSDEQIERRAEFLAADALDRVWSI